MFKESKIPLSRRRIALPVSSAPTEDVAFRRHPRGPPPPVPPRPPPAQDIPVPKGSSTRPSPHHLGRPVCVGGVQVGLLKYVGPASFGQGIWCGIEFAEQIGKNDGSVQGVRYFHCRPGHGIMAPLPKVEVLPMDRVEKAPSPITSPPHHLPPPPPPPPRQKQLPNIQTPPREIPPLSQLFQTPPSPIFHLPPLDPEDYLQSPLSPLSPPPGDFFTSTPLLKAEETEDSLGLLTPNQMRDFTGIEDLNDANDVPIDGVEEEEEVMEGSSGGKVELDNAILEMDTLDMEEPKLVDDQEVDNVLDDEVCIAMMGGEDDQNVDNMDQETDHEMDGEVDNEMEQEIGSEIDHEIDREMDHKMDHKLGTCKVDHVLDNEEIHEGSEIMDNVLDNEEIHEGSEVMDNVVGIEVDQKILDNESSDHEVEPEESEEAHELPAPSSLVSMSDSLSASAAEPIECPQTHQQVNRNSRCRPNNNSGGLNNNGMDSSLITTSVTCSVISVTSGASLDTGYQGDFSEGGTPPEQAGSPVGGSSSTPLHLAAAAMDAHHKFRFEALTDSDFCSDTGGAAGTGTEESEAEGEMPVLARDRMARVIDGTLYNGESNGGGGVKVAAVLPATREGSEMDSSGVFSDMESNNRHARTDVDTDSQMDTAEDDQGGKVVIDASFTIDKSTVQPDLTIVHMVEVRVSTPASEMVEIIPTSDATPVAKCVVLSPMNDSVNNPLPSEINVGANASEPTPDQSSAQAENKPVANSDGDSKAGKTPHRVAASRLAENRSEMSRPTRPTPLKTKPAPPKPSPLPSPKPTRQPRKAMPSKVKSMLETPQKPPIIKKDESTSSGEGHENQENTRPVHKPPPRKNRWADVMDKIAQGKKEEKMKPRAKLREVKSRVFSTVAPTGGGSARSSPAMARRNNKDGGGAGVAMAGRSAQGVAGHPRSRRLAKSNPCEPSSSGVAGTSHNRSLDTSPHSSTSDISDVPANGKTPLKHIRDWPKSKKAELRPPSQMSDHSSLSATSHESGGPRFRFPANRNSPLSAAQSTRTPQMKTPAGRLASSNRNPPSRRHQSQTPSKLSPLRDQNRIPLTSKVRSGGTPNKTDHTGGSSDNGKLASKSEVQAELKRLESLCDAQEKGLQQAKQQLAHSSRGFQALAVLVNYLTCQLDDTKEKEKLQGELVSLKLELDLARVCLRQLQDKCESDKAAHLEEVQRIKSGHEDELKALNTRAEYLHDEHQKEVATLELRLQEHAQALTLAQEEVSALKAQQAEAESRAESEARAREAEAEAGAAVLAEAEARAQLREPKSVLENEVHSLGVVLEMKSAEVRDLRKRNQDLELQAEQLEVWATKVRLLEARVEDLQTQVRQKTDLERQLSSEKVRLMESVGRESREKERLTQRYEELQWRFRQNMERTGGGPRDAPPCELEEKRLAAPLNGSCPSSPAMSSGNLSSRPAIPASMSWSLPVERRPIGGASAAGVTARRLTRRPRCSSVSTPGANIGDTTPFRRLPRIDTCAASSTIACECHLRKTSSAPQPQPQQLLPPQPLPPPPPPPPTFKAQQKTRRNNARRLPLRMCCSFSEFESSRYPEDDLDEDDADISEGSSRSVSPASEPLPLLLESEDSCGSMSGTPNPAIVKDSLVIVGASTEALPSDAGEESDFCTQPKNGGGEMMAESMGSEASSDTTSGRQENVGNGAGDSSKAASDISSVANQSADNVPNSANPTTATKSESTALDLSWSEDLDLLPSESEV